MQAGLRAAEGLRIFPARDRAGDEDQREDRGEAHRQRPQALLVLRERPALGWLEDRRWADRSPGEASIRGAPVSNVRELPRQTAVHEEASAGIARIDRGLSGAEQAELDEWLARNPEHERALMRMAKLWDRMDVLARLADVCPVRPRTSSRVPRLLTAMAASIALAASVLAWFSLG